MSKTIVDCALAYSTTYGVDLTFIPSRRQIDWDGGYVGWTTKEFAEYVRSKSSRCKIERDHGGPGQGACEDDGFRSLEEDCLYVDLIHIDPWKAYPAYADGLAWTIRMIEFCSQRNPSLRFEVGTEQGIRPFDVEELDTLLRDLRSALSPNLFEKIQFAVIQCGTQLLERSNIGTFDEDKLRQMLSVVESHGLTAKEHNGDWVPAEVVRRKEMLGLQTINIAPELGELQTSVLLRKTPDIDALYAICFASGKWTKWVSPGFIPEDNKETLIRICGHYVSQVPEIRAQIDANITEINSVVTLKLHELMGTEGGLQV